VHLQYDLINVCVLLLHETDSMSYLEYLTDFIHFGGQFSFGSNQFIGPDFQVLQVSEYPSSSSAVRFSRPVAKPVAKLSQKLG